MVVGRVGRVAGVGVAVQGLPGERLAGEAGGSAAEVAEVVLKGRRPHLQFIYVQRLYCMQLAVGIFFKYIFTRVQHIPRW